MVFACISVIVSLLDNEQAILAAAFDSLRQIRLDSLALCRLNFQAVTLQSLLFRVERFPSLSHLNLSHTSLAHVIDSFPRVLLSQSRLLTLNLSSCDLATGALKRFWLVVESMGFFFFFFRYSIIVSLFICY
jgi:hypothetical protein